MNANDKLATTWGHGEITHYTEEKTLNNINFNRKLEKETIEYLNFSWNYCKNSKIMMMKATDLDGVNLI